MQKHGIIDDQADDVHLGEDQFRLVDVRLALLPYHKLYLAYTITFAIKTENNNSFSKMEFKFSKSSF